MSPFEQGPDKKKGRPPGGHNKPKFPGEMIGEAIWEWTWTGESWVKSEDLMGQTNSLFGVSAPSEQLVEIIPPDYIVEDKMPEEVQPKTIAERLAAPFPPERVRWRVSKIWNVGGVEKSLALAYIDARDVMDRLDEVFGVGGWSREQRLEGETNICSLVVRFQHEDTGEAGCAYCGHEWVKYEDVAEPTDFEETKGGASDSFKRAAVNIGVGRYLYGLGNTIVTLEDHKIPQHEIQRLVKDVLGGGKKLSETINPSAAVEEYMSSERKEIYMKAVKALGKAGADEIIKGVSQITGEWASITPILKMKYLSLLNDSFSVLNDPPK